MKLIVCVDDDYGMCFNHRRQSRDRIVVDKILEITAGKKLWVAPYSVGIFPQNIELHTDLHFLEKSEKGDFCFAEIADINDYLEKAEQLFLFRWNRKYPSDLKFPADKLNTRWTLQKTEEFAGSSHNMITMEVYAR